MYEFKLKTYLKVEMWLWISRIFHPLHFPKVCVGGFVTQWEDISVSLLWHHGSLVSGVRKIKRQKHKLHWFIKCLQDKCSPKYLSSGFLHSLRSWPQTKNSVTNCSNQELPQAPDKSKCKATLKETTFSPGFKKFPQTNYCQQKI